MSKTFRIIVKVFTIAIVILAIAIAYVWGVMEGAQSRLPYIRELLEELHPERNIDFYLVTHPLWYPLQNIAFIFGVCWIIIAVIALQEKRKEQT